MKNKLKKKSVIHILYFVNLTIILIMISLIIFANLRSSDIDNISYINRLIIFHFFTPLTGPFAVLNLILYFAYENHIKYLCTSIVCLLLFTYTYVIFWISSFPY